jgi:hypothetical protein
MYENMNLERGFIYGVGFTIEQGFICQLIRYVDVCHFHPIINSSGA